MWVETTVSRNIKRSFRPPALIQVQIFCPVEMHIIQVGSPKRRSKVFYSAQAEVTSTKCHQQNLFYPRISLELIEVAT
jgi:hypothetical protein